MLDRVAGSGNNLSWQFLRTFAVLSMVVYLCVPNLQAAQASQHHIRELREIDHFVPGLGVDEGDPLGELDFDHLSSDQGLSQNSVLCILKDSQGFMWFGTLDGLNRYDGYNFTVYKPDPDNPYSLSDNTIIALLEDRYGSIWIGTSNGGLNRYDRQSNRFIHYRHDPSDPDSISSDNILSIHQDRAGQLWVGTAGGGLNRFDPNTESFSRFQNTPGDTESLSSNNVYAILEDRSGALWIGTGGGGLNRMYFPALSNPQADNLSLAPPSIDEGLPVDRPFFVAYKHIPGDPDSLSHNDVYTLFEDRSGVLWIGTGDGNLNRYEHSTGSFQNYQLAPRDPLSPQENTIRSIHQDADGALWVGLEHEGLFRFDPNTKQVHKLVSDPANPRSLSSSTVRTVYVDPLGILWVGTNGGGLNKYAAGEKEFNHYRHEPQDLDSLGADQVTALFVDHAGTLWVGTNGGGLDRLDSGSDQFVHYRHNPEEPFSLGSNVIYAVYEDRDDNLWIGTGESGLARFDRHNERFYHYQSDPANAATVSGNTISTIFEDHTGALWVGTYTRGLNLFARHSETFTRFLHIPANPLSVSNNTIRVIYEDRSANLWIGTGNGLNRYDWESGGFIQYYHDPENSNSLSDNDVNSITEDHYGNLWIGTNGGGLDQFDPQTEIFTHYHTKDGLANDVVYGIMEDQHGNLWLSTNKGISRFNLQTKTFKNYDDSDGLPGSEFNPNAFYRDPDGQMFFGGFEGFIAFYPQRIRDDPYIPPVVLTSITQGGEEVQHTQSIETLEEITFRWPNNFFEFEFAALSYVQPAKNQYAYMLEGFDDTWIQAGQRRFGRYTNLPGGEYTLHVIGSNQDGVWNETGTKVRIRILPPIWETAWFRGGLLVLLVAGVITGYRFRVSRIQKRTIELEEMVRQRTQEVERRRLVAEGLREIMILLNSNRSLEESLDFIVSRATHLTSADRAVIYKRDQEEIAEILASYARERGHHIGPEELQDSLMNSIAPLIYHGQPVVMPSLSRRAYNGSGHASFEIGQYNALLCIPISVGGDIFGGLALFYIKERAFSNEDIEQGMLFADQAALAIGNARLRERIKQMAVVTERNRLARDLHDAVTQTLFSASLIAEALPGLYESDPDDGRQLLAELRQLSRGALAEMRTLLLELRPAAVCEANFSDLLRQLTEAASGRAGQMVSLEIHGQHELPPDIQVAFYRIAQEALNNVVKHSRATQVRVYLAINTTPDDQLEGVTLQVSDDGIGFEPYGAPQDHLGLSIMTERAHAIGARLLLDSKPGHGTVVRLIWLADTKDRPDILLPSENRE